MKYVHQLTVILAFTIVQSSCNSWKSGGPCEETLTINQTSVVVSFKDQAGKYLYSQVNPSYNKDSLKVFDPFGTQLKLLSSLDQIPNTNSLYWVINFGNVYNPSTDANPFTNEVCKNFIVKYNAIETDTIKACFKGKNTRCSPIFETFKVYYKGQLIGTANNTTSIQVTILKN